MSVVPRSFHRSVQVWNTENFDHPQTVRNFCQYTIWGHYNTFAYAFTSVVLIRMLPGTLNSFSVPMTSLFCFECFSVPTLPLNCTHMKMISTAAFHIIGLAKFPRIEFLPLDWIYHFVRILMVILCMYMQVAGHIAMHTLVLAVDQSFWMMSSVPQVPASCWNAIVGQFWLIIVSTLLMLV